eukprot:593575-Rhodomonas_salina.1
MVFIHPDVYDADEARLNGKLDEEEARWNRKRDSRCVAPAGILSVKRLGSAMFRSDAGLSSAAHDTHARNHLAGRRLVHHLH